MDFASKCRSFKALTLSLNHPDVFHHFRGHRCTNADSFYKHLRKSESLSAARCVPLWYRDRTLLCNKARFTLDGLSDVTLAVYLYYHEDLKALRPKSSGKFTELR